MTIVKYRNATLCMSQPNCAALLRNSVLHAEEETATRGTYWNCRPPLHERRAQCTLGTANLKLLWTNIWMGSMYVVYVHRIWNCRKPTLQHHTPQCTTRVESAVWAWATLMLLTRGRAMYYNLEAAENPWCSTTPLTAQWGRSLICEH